MPSLPAANLRTARAYTVTQHVQVFLVINEFVVQVK